MLQSLPNNVYASKFIEIVLDQFWQPAQKRLIYREVLPNCAFILISTFYIYQSLDP